MARREQGPRNLPLRYRVTILLLLLEELSRLELIGELINKCLNIFTSFLLFVNLLVFSMVESNALLKSKLTHILLIYSSKSFISMCVYSAT